MSSEAGGPAGPKRPGPDPVRNREPWPRSIKEAPGYAGRVAGQFFHRFSYIIRLTVETSPLILLLLSVLSVLEGLIPVAQAYVGAKILNVLAEAFIGGTQTYEQYLSQIMGLLILQFACIISRHVIHALNNIVHRVAGEMVVNHVNRKIMDKARNLDTASFDRPEFYEKLENASRESGNQPMRILRALFTTASALISMTSFVMLLWAVNPLAPFLIVCASLPSALLSLYFRKKNFLYIRRRSKDRRQMAYYKDMLVNKDSAKEIRIFRLADFMIRRYGEIFTHYFKGLKKLLYREGVYNLLMSVISAVVNCYLFFYIAARVVKGSLQVGDYSLYTGALNSISNGINTVINNIAVIYEGTLFIDNMIVFMDEETLIRQMTPPESAAVPGGRRDGASDGAVPRLQRHVGHRIEFEHVYFRYPNQKRYVLEDINVTLEPGESVVLVGLNGAGKTTFIKLLIRLYDPTEGRILLDGVDLRRYPPEELYEIYGIIFQDFVKYAVSVEENIAFGKISSPLDRIKVREAAAFSNAADFIERLPMQYDTPLMRIFEEEGMELSIGQWQKLSIARAFYSDADILILDEPTAALDAMAEQEIYNRFDELSENKTTVFVSHRLSSATTADKIVVLEYGRIIELGTHQELMEQRGSYYKLFSTQAERYLREEIK